MELELGFEIAFLLYMLEFLIPILYLEKPARVMFTLDIIIFGALTKEQEVDWALVFWHTSKRLLAGVGKSKSTPICPYVFHLCHACDTLKLDDNKVYMVGKSMLKHNIELDQEDEPIGAGDSEREILDAVEIVELQV